MEPTEEPLRDNFVKMDATMASLASFHLTRDARYLLDCMVEKMNWNNEFILISDNMTLANGLLTNFCERILPHKKRSSRAIQFIVQELKTFAFIRKRELNRLQRKALPSGVVEIWEIRPTYANKNKKLAGKICLDWIEPPSIPEFDASQTEVKRTRMSRHVYYSPQKSRAKEPFEYEAIIEEKDRTINALVGMASTMHIVMEMAKRYLPQDVKDTLPAIPYLELVKNR